MPIIWTLVGLSVIVLCLYVIKTIGGMWYKRKVREAISADIDDQKSHDSQSKVG
jgi:hypothetical protein